MNAEENSELPQGWSVASLQEIAKINPRLDKSAYSDDLQVSFVPMPAVEAETGAIDVSAIRQFGAVKKGYTSFREGDVLFAKITPCMENGKMAVVPAVINGLGFGSTEFHVLRPHDGITAEYIYYYVSSLRFRYDAEHNMTGAVGQRRVPAPYLAQHPIPVAPEKTQKHIVAKIEELLSELDKGRESLTTAKEQLEVYRQAVLKHAFEGKLTEQWREDNKDKLESAEELLASITNERECRHKKERNDWKASVVKWEAKGQQGKKPSKPRTSKEITSLSDSEVTALSELPTNWFWDKLGWMTCRVEYGTAAKSSKSGKVPVLRMGNIQNAKLDWDDLVYTSDKTEIEQYLLQPGDVLFNRTNSPELVGKTAIYRGERPALFAGYLIRVNQLETVVDSQYLNLFLNSHIAKQHGNTVKTDGVNQSNINGEKLQNYPFPYCSLAEQQEIVRFLDEKLSVIDQMEYDINQDLRKSKSLRQSILTKAFSGQLVERDTQDEPAPVLLEHIKAENAEQENNNKKNKRRNAA